MAKTNSSLDTPLREQVQALAAFEPRGVPAVSLYLNLTPDQHGRDNYRQFCRKSFAAQLKAFKENSTERASFERDIERINEYLENELNRSSNGLAIFACAGAGEFFQAVQLDAAIGEHWLFVGEVPHIYPLVRLIDQYPRYAVVLLDTNHARILVFGLGNVERSAQLTGVKTRRTSMGGCSQARYQRHAENFHLHHIKEVVDTLDRVVRAENIQQIVIAGEEVAVPLLKEALPPRLSEKTVDIMKFDRQAVDDEIARTTLELLRQKDAETDSERVAELIGAWQSSGLGVVGPEATMQALQMGQVEELLITAIPQILKPIQKQPTEALRAPLAAATSAPNRPDDTRLQLADELVARANRSGARVRILEDPSLLQEHGGVGAMLRFRI